MTPTISAHYTPSNRQRGITLIELMVGIVIGLLTIAVAMGALMVSRNISGTVSDTSQIQQQASYALRTISWQLRQAGTPSLDLAPLKSSATGIQAADPVAFKNSDQTIGISGTDNAPNATPPTQTTLNISYNRDKIYTANGASGTVDLSQQRDCLGGPTDPNITLIQSNFTLDAVNHELKCTGSNNNSAQAIIGNVANFSVRYMVQTESNTNAPKIQYLSASQVNANSNWPNVTAVEVCLVVYGDEAIDMPPGTSYTDCPNVTNGDRQQVSMTSSNLPPERHNRMHMTFRNVYQLRSQNPSS